MKILDRFKETKVKIEEVNSIRENKIVWFGDFYDPNEDPSAIPGITQYLNTSIPADFSKVFNHDFNEASVNWKSLEELNDGLWQIQGKFHLTGYEFIWGYSIKKYNTPPTVEKPWDFFLERKKLLEEEKLFSIGGFAKFQLLCRFVEDTHELYIWVPSANTRPHKLTVKLEQFLELFLCIGMVESGPIYLTEEFPEELLSFKYDGFFEKVERLFPEADLSAFRHRDRFTLDDSIVVEFGALNYGEKVRDAFGNLPTNSRIVRWHPHFDIPQFQGSYLTLIGWQLGFGKQLSSSMIAFWMMSERTLFKWVVEEEIKANFEFPLLHEIFIKYHAPDHYKISIKDAPNLENKYLFYTDPYNDMLVEFHGEGVCTFHLLYLEADDYTTHFITDDFDWLVNQLFQTRGMFWWNYFLVFTPSASDQRYEKFYQQLVAYFPEADRSRYPDPAQL